MRASFEVRHVLAGAYRGRDIGRRALLSHVAVLDLADGSVIATLCGTVDPDHLADADARLDPRLAVPSCTKCAVRLPKWLARLEPTLWRPCAAVAA